MPVQAQHPSNVLFSEFRKRARQEGCDAIAETSVQNCQMHLTSKGLLAETGISCFPVSDRVKFLEGSKQQVCASPDLNPKQRNSDSSMLSKNNGRAAFQCSELSFLPPVSWARPSDIRNAADDIRPVPIANSAMDLGANQNTTSCSLLEDPALNLHYWQQESEMNDIIATHNELLKQTLEERRRQHTRALLEFIDYSVLSRVRERLVEIEKIRRRNVELEEHVKKLSLDSQVWMNIAQSQEALVTSLKSNLETIVAQRNEKGRDCHAEDAESCILGDPLAVNDVNFRAQELEGLGQQWKCRHCRKNGVSVLVLPCRHLCLCTDCDPTVTDCPICRTLKDASLQVYMD